MDIETENVINLLFPESIPELWKENPEFYQYLLKLSGFDIDQLNKEPDHLSDEKNAVLHTTQELVFVNYKTFIQTAESSREILNHFNETENRLDKLVQKIPKFIEKCQSFCDTSKDINAHRRLNSLTLTRNAELLEILEMPQLMESCLRSNQYNEALELSQYARQLGVKHGDIPIISSIVAEIENSWSRMVGQVIGSLRGDLPLPRCLQLVGFLRSMDAFTEPELRIKFLQARDNWLQGLLNAISKEDPNLHIVKTIELSRIHLFNIITQYKAMFNDNELTIPDRDLTLNESAIFYHWLEEKISQFLATLEQDLPGVTSIDSILGQCTYFGLSFGRIGVDFTGRISDIFVRIIGEKFEQNIRKSTRKFEKDMETFTLINKTQRLDVKTETAIIFENPPEQLVEFYPLAEYCNGIITAFNELRLCAPVALSTLCTKLLQESLHNVAKAMLLFYKQEQQAFAAVERENMIKFMECLSEKLIPYIQYCIHLIFPPIQIAMHLGTSVSVLQKEEVTYLNKQIILEPVAILLPIKKNPLISKLCVSNIQPLIHDAKPSLPISLSTEIVDSTKTIVLETKEAKEREETEIVDSTMTIVLETEEAKEKEETEIVDSTMTIVLETEEAKEREETEIVDSTKTIVLETEEAKEREETEIVDSTKTIVLETEEAKEREETEIVDSTMTIVLETEEAKEKEETEIVDSTKTIVLETEAKEREKTEIVDSTKTIILETEEAKEREETEIVDSTMTIVLETEEAKEREETEIVDSTKTIVLETEEAKEREETEIVDSTKIIVLETEEAKEITQKEAISNHDI